MQFKIKKNHPDAITPKFSLPGDAGMDIYSVEDVTVKPGIISKIRTGITIEIPTNTTLILHDKSGRAASGLKMVGGVFDENFRGEIIVLCTSLTTDLEIKKGEKITQAIILPVIYPEIVEVEELSESNRGIGAFGSTGLS